MSTTWEIQRQLFERIKNEVGNRQDWVKELETVLHVSKDAVYRRLRGDTLLNLEDLRHLASVYRVSIDQLVQSGLHTMVSDFQAIPNFSLEKYLERMKENFLRQEGQDIRIYFNARELPIFYLFKYPDLLAFKYFFWQNTFIDDREKSDTYKPHDISVRSIELSREILDVYGQIPSLELWSKEILTTTLSQIEYYHDMGSLTDEDKTTLLARLIDLIDDLEEMTDEGHKTISNERAKVDVYLNEILPGDNTLLVESDQQYQAVLTQQVVNSVIINDQVFCENALAAILSIVEKSTLISSAGEKSRKKFFRQLRRQVKQEVD